MVSQAAGLVRLANCTSHWQANNASKYRRLGFEVSVVPLLPHFGNDEDPLLVARDAVAECVRMGVDGALVAGRTDVGVYVAILAVQAGLSVWTPVTSSSSRIKGVSLPPYRTALMNLQLMRLALTGDGVRIAD